MGTCTCLMFLLLALPSALSMSHKDPGSLFYPYGSAYNDHVTHPEDDGGTDHIALTHSFNFFKEIHRTVFMNNNRAISFKQPVTEYTPDAFPIPDLYMICPFWGDVDNECEGSIYYRQTTDEKLMSRLSDDINRMFEDMDFFSDWAFIVTWHKVACHQTESNKMNIFQAVLTTDGPRSIVMFIYDDFQWTTYTASSGDPKTGLRGIPSQAGFNTANKYFNIPFSRAERVTNVKSSSNVGVPGLSVFRVDEFMVPGGCIYKDSFLHHGQAIWSDKGCNTQCSCKMGGKVVCEDKACDEGLVCMPLGRHYLCQIDEEDRWVST